MDNTDHRPELIVIAGPNGSGKTTVTTQFLHHEWSDGVLYINPDQIGTISPTINAARIAKRVIEGGHDVPITKIVSRYQKSMINCRLISGIVDRLYIYDNSVDNQAAQILFRLSYGELAKRYVRILPEWAAKIMK
ncbi:MAG: zeta toxin family protein [Muribaculaceae bacterium]|nr:zeta toxin family protein [Muribaculaceae bacterium]